jgi:UDPglucose 6-dehydrogenase
VIGSGYVGLVAGACFSDTGNDVTCADISEEKVEALKAGVIPIYEPGLHEIVERNSENGRLHFTTDVPSAIRDNDVIFIAVGTPMDGEGAADLQYVRNVAETIGDNLNGYKVIVDKSTVPVGTADMVTNIIATRATGEFSVVSNPEFLKEGAAVQDFLKPDRIIIGTDDERARDVMGRLYAPFQRTSNRIIHMDVRSAEMTKYAANAMLATRISFMNDIARLCEEVGADVDYVRRGVGSDPRIGSKFLFPGVGFGGSCFPKDLRALIQTGREYNRDMKVLKAVVDVNRAQKVRLVERVVEQFGEDLSDKTFALWGLAFKPETDDMREAPSIEIVKGLKERGATVRGHDPVALKTAEEVLGDDVEYYSDNYAALKDADALIVVTEWSQYRTPDFDRIKTLLETPVIFDGRNLYRPDLLEELGFTHYSIGRRVVRNEQ